MHKMLEVGGVKILVELSFSDMRKVCVCVHHNKFITLELCLLSE